MKFVLIHGAFGNPEDNWFPYLKKHLELLEQEVIVPQFPVDTWDEVTKGGRKAKSRYQTLEIWQATFKKVVLPQIKKEKNLVFVGHSLGPVFTLHIVNKFNLKLDCAIFIAPFLEKLNESWQIDLVNGSFYKKDFDFEKLKKLIPNSYVIYSDNDPYVDPKYPLDFAGKMGSNKIMIRGAKHFNSEARFLSFPLVYELCKTRLDAVDYL